MVKLETWLAAHWVAAAVFMSVALLAVVPLVVGPWWPGLLLIYLHSPGYMVHQVEEHADDRFRKFVNARLFGGRQALTIGDVLWINLPGVWGLNLACLHAAFWVNPGWGLAAPYLMLVNAMGHGGMMLRLRCYNPGLATSALIFFPLSAITLYLVPATLAQHGVGLGIAVAVHVAIALSAGLRASRGKAASA